MSTSNRKARKTVQTRLEFDMDHGEDGAFFVVTSMNGGVNWHRLEVPFDSDVAALHVATTIRVAKNARFEP